MSEIVSQVQDDPKRKRESSSNSTSSVSVQKKAKDDHLISPSILENSVFNTPAPASMASLPADSNNPSTSAPTDGMIRSISIGSNLSVGMHSQSSSPDHSSHSTDHSQVKPDSSPPEGNTFGDNFATNPEARSWLTDIMNFNRTNTKADIIQAVNSAIDHKLTNQQDYIAQHVYNAVEHKVDVRYDELDRKFNSLQLKYDKLEERMDRVDKKSVENDQYARRYTIRIRGIEEHQNEDLCAIIVHIVRRMQINIYNEDIEVIHRAGFFQHGKHRVILCRFKDRGLKYQVMLQRKMLKGTGITFDEDLCKEYETLLHELKDHQNVRRIWSWNGKVHAEDKNGVKHTLRYGRNWTEFFDKLDEQPIQHPMRPHLNNQRSNSRHMPPSSAPPTQPPVSSTPLSQPSLAPSAGVSSTITQPLAARAISTSASAPSTASGAALTSLASISLAALCSVSTCSTTTSLSQSAASTSTMVTSSVLGPIPASTAASAAPGVSYSMAAASTLLLPPQQGPPLRIPLKDIGLANTVLGDMSAFHNPPTPTRFSGAPMVTMSPKPTFKQPGGLLGLPVGKGGSLPASPRRVARRGSTSGQRTPRNQKVAVEQPPISPNISSYFPLKPT